MNKVSKKYYYYSYRTNSILKMLKMGQTRPLFHFFRLSSLQFLQQINVKNVHPIYGAGIRTHDRLNMSLLP